MNNSNINKQELATLVFNEELKSNVENTLKNHYGVKTVNYRLMTYGMGIEISGSDSFDFIRGAMVKVSWIANRNF